jgi:hypothetical protein
MKLSKEILENLINEVMEEAMPPLSKKAKRLTQIAKDIEKEFDRPATPEEKEEEEKRYQDSVSAEIERQRQARFRLDQDRMDYLRTAKAAQGGNFQTTGPDGEMNVRGIGATIGDEGPEPEVQAPDFRMTRAGPRGGGRMSEGKKK